MDFLVITPPVCTPAEPAAGAYMLTAALRGHGYDASLLDLSLEFYHRVLGGDSQSGPSAAGSLKYLMECEGGYDPLRHRGATGALHKRLNGFETKYPGWKLTLMDLTCPGGALDPIELSALPGRGDHPFRALFEDVLAPALEEHRPGRVLVSLAYLSQLPAAISLVRFLVRFGITPIVGGSLPTSLHATGFGIDSLKKVFPKIVLGEGTELFPEVNGRLHERLLPPRLISKRRYISSRPIIPLALSSGCFWRSCLFCPDRYQEYHPVPMHALAGFLDALTRQDSQKKPMIHLLDSAVPPGQLRAFVPLAKQYDVDFYGFARPTLGLVNGGLMEDAASAGLSMLQLGVESGSGALLERFNKGIDPGEAETVLRAASEAGVRTYLYLLFGLPGETDADRNATLRLIERNGDAIDFLNLSVFNLPRHCELTSRAKEFDIQIGDFPSDGAIRLYWPFTTSGGVSPRDQAREFLRGTFNKHPAVKAANLRTPRWFRAAHMALMDV